MIVYTSKCLACANKPLWKKLKDYAHKNKIRFEIRRTDVSALYRIQADGYNMQLPFVIKDGAAVRIEDL